ncbi:hypothetical protein JOL62DRAFT_560590 [Phyllosticta paracitricarpa]|uniref:Uncharacterized protein n=1 Tax=Phyllosticta paracitricarpa TaxID=2016321 RepID=A0ABR1MTQ0_9PEZI
MYKIIVFKLVIKVILKLKKENSIIGKRIRRSIILFISITYKLEKSYILSLNTNISFLAIIGRKDYLDLLISSLISNSFLISYSKAKLIISRSLYKPLGKGIRGLIIYKAIIEKSYRNILVYTIRVRFLYNNIYTTKAPKIILLLSINYYLRSSYITSKFNKSLSSLKLILGKVIRVVFIVYSIKGASYNYTILIIKYYKTRVNYITSSILKSITRLSFRILLV